jgi:hypothetical protein
MLRRRHHIVIYLLLFSYLLLGAAGYLETLVISGFGTEHHITKTADNHSSTFQAYYTQHKHIPSTVKIAVPSPAVFTPPEIPRICIYSITFTQFEFSTVLDPSFSQHSSRAPPQI